MFFFGLFSKDREESAGS